MIYDVVVIGGGPAGLTAALYSLRAGRSVLVIEKEGFGGQMTYSPKIENYPGFTSISGNELAANMVEQVIAQGAEITMEEVIRIDTARTDNIKVITTDIGAYEARAVIIAVGVKHRLLNVPGEEKFLGEGISFCALCDGAFYEGKEVAVIGGGNSALQEAILLSKTSKKVTIIQNLDFLTGEKKLIDILENTPNVEIILGYTVDSFEGDEKITGVTIRSAKDSSTKTVAIDGVFTAIGLAPANDRFSNVAALDERGYFAADESGITSTKGIFVAGDCRTKRVRQISAACSDGAWCSVAAGEYLDSLDK